jgi:hypothetical protein
MAYASFGQGILSVLDRASSMQKNADNNRYREGMLELSRNQDERQKEVQPLVVEGKRLENQEKRLKHATDLLTFNKNEYTDAALLYHNSAGLTAEVFEKEIDSAITGTNKAAFLGLINTSRAGKLNRSIDEKGNVISGKIADFKKVGDESTGFFYEVTIQPGNGAAPGPMTENRTVNGDDLVKRIPAESFEASARNLLATSYIEVGIKGDRAKYNTMSELERQAILAVEAEQKARDELLKKIEAIPDEIDLGKKTELIGMATAANGDELKALIQNVGLTDDPTSFLAELEAEARAEYEAEGENYRADGARKSQRGFLGPVENTAEGGTMTEVSIGVQLNGEEMDIPTMVPGLTQDEIDTLANMQIEGNAANIPDSIVQKAKDHAQQRIAAGKSPFYFDGEEAVDELRALQTTDANGKVTFSDPKRAKELEAEVKSLVGDKSFNALINTEGRKAQKGTGEKLTEWAEDQVDAYMKLWDTDPAQAAALTAMGLISIVPAVRVGGWVVKGGAKVLKHVTTKAKKIDKVADKPGRIKKIFTRNKKPEAPTSSAGGATRQSPEQLRTAQQQRRNNEGLQRRDYSDYDTPPTQRTGPAEVRVSSPLPGGGAAPRSRVGQALDSTKQAISNNNPIAGRRIAPARIAIAAGATDYVLDSFADENGEVPVTNIEQVTGRRPKFSFNSDEALREAIINEANDPDSELTQTFLMKQGINAENFKRELPKLKTEDQLRAIFAVAKSSGASVDDQLKMVERMSNLFVTGSMDVNADQQQQTVNQTYNSVTSRNNSDEQRRQGEFDRNEKRNPKPDQPRLDRFATGVADIEALLVDDGGAYTDLNFGNVKSKVNELWRMSANSINRNEKAAAQEAALDATMSFMGAISATQSAGMNWSDQMDSFFGNDAQLTIGNTAEHLRAETKIVAGNERVSGFYFRDPATKAKRLNFPIDIATMRSLMGTRLVAEIERIARANNEADPEA